MKRPKRMTDDEIKEMVKTLPPPLTPADPRNQPYIDPHDHPSAIGNYPPITGDSRESEESYSLRMDGYIRDKVLEIDRLRAALTEISGTMLSAKVRTSEQWWVDCVDIARKALAK